MLTAESVVLDGLTFLLFVTGALFCGWESITLLDEDRPLALLCGFAGLLYTVWVLYWLLGFMFRD